MVFGLRLGLPSRKSSAEPPSSEVASSAPGLKSALTVNEFVAKTKKSREKGLEPTKPELISYAKYLGIDPVIDGDLMWIADEALRAPLPCEWTEHHDSSERIFYYNVDTHESSWTHPLEQLHRDTYKSIVNFRSGSLSKDQQVAELEKLRQNCEKSEREAHKELQSWTEHTDDQGQKFYYHKASQRSVWTDPRPARCHTLYLQMKALRVLGKICGQAVSPRATERLIPEKCAPLARPASKPLPDERMGMRSPGPGRGPAGKSLSPMHASQSEKAGKKSKKDGKMKNRGSRVLSASLSLEEAIGNEIQMKKSGGLMDFKKPVLLEDFQKDFQKPHGEECRGGMGVSASLPLLGGGSPMGDPFGEGLSNVGRARVRAGIRLEPIKASEC